MYSGLHAKLLTEIRADGVKAGSSFSPRPPCCLLRLCQMFLQDGFGFFFFFLVFTCSGSNQQLCHMFDGGSGWLLPGYKLLQNEILTSEQVVAI